MANHVTTGTPYFSKFKIYDHNVCIPSGHNRRKAVCVILTIWQLQTVLAILPTGLHRGD